jgi:hypothetical protein
MISYDVRHFFSPFFAAGRDIKSVDIRVSGKFLFFQG